jgi:hypothetical protein
VLNASAYSAGFNDYSNVEWIWGSAQVLTKLITIWGMAMQEQTILPSLY